MSKIICIIPARKGSKRLVGKNIKDFCGKPLIFWTVEQALSCKFINEIIITTDDQEILEMCKGKYSDKRIRLIDRPKEFATDDTPMETVIFHALGDVPFDTLIILLQPTSPLRTKKNISQALDLYQGNLGCAVVSVFREDDLHFKLNGAIYIFTFGYLELFRNIIGRDFLKIYIMSKEGSVDIDTQEDWDLAEQIMKERLENE